MKGHLNLIPLATQRLYASRRIVRFWSAVIALAGIGCLLACGIEWGRGLAASQQLQAFDARFAPLAKLLEEQRELSELVANLHAREQISLELSNETQGVSLLGVISQAASELNGAVYVAKLEYDSSVQSGKGQRDHHRLLHLGGAGTDSMSVATFAAGLRDSGVFDSVTVDSTRSFHGGEPSLRTFEINCLF